MELLGTSELFKGAPEAMLEQVSAKSSVRRFKKGEMIFKEGTREKEFYIVKSGLVAINKNIAGGRKRNLSNLGPGEVFGEITLFDEDPRSADAEASEDTELIVFRNDDFLKLLNDNPVFGYEVQKNIIRVLCRRLRATDEMLKEGVIWGFRIQA